MDTQELTIRAATEDDGGTIRWLAQLDSASAPPGDLLLAERGGEVVAAVSIEQDVAIANPFVPTAEALEVLRVRAGQLRLARRDPRRERRWTLRLARRPAR